MLLEKLQAKDMKIPEMAKLLGLTNFTARSVLMTLTANGSVVPVSRDGHAYVYGIPRGREAVVPNALKGRRLLQLLGEAPHTRSRLCAIFKFRTADLDAVVNHVNSTGETIFFVTGRPEGGRGKPTLTYFVEATRAKVPSDRPSRAASPPPIPEGSPSQVTLAWSGDLPPADAYSSMISQLLSRDSNVV